MPNRNIDEPYRGGNHFESFSSVRQQIEENADCRRLAGAVDILATAKNSLAARR
jgi:hypothetical protein